MVLPKSLFDAHQSAPDRSELCATCVEPGRCCRAFYLATREEGEAEVRTGKTRDEVQAMLDRKGWPFLPVARRPFVVDGVEVDAWLFTCPELNAEGRCSVYENRPQLCRDFKAGSDPLCVYYEGDT